MLTKINYIWRLFATALSFFIFGLGGLLLRVLVFPFLGVITAEPLEKIKWAQRCVHYSFYIFIGLMHKIGVMTYQINGLEKLNRPNQLILANHPTLIDIVFLISRIPLASCIIKEKLFYNPFTKGPVTNAGYISNAKPEKMLNDCENYLRSGGTIIIFPEGTRTVANVDYKFQRGAAAIALQAKAIISPVTLSCYPSTLTKSEKWYQIPKQKFHLTMTVGDDIVLDDFLAMKHRSIATRRLTCYLQDYFTQQREQYE